MERPNQPNTKPQRVSPGFVREAEDKTHLTSTCADEHQRNLIESNAIADEAHTPDKVSLPHSRPAAGLSSGLIILQPTLDEELNVRGLTGFRSVADLIKQTLPEQLSLKIEPRPQGEYLQDQEERYTSIDRVIVPSRLRVYIFSSGPFPLPVPCGVLRLTVASNNLLLWDICYLVFGCRLQYLQGSFILQQASRLQRVKGPMYWLPARNLDPRPHKMRVGDTTQFAQMGWTVVENRAWLLLTYEPDRPESKEDEAKDIEPKKVVAQNTETKQKNKILDGEGSNIRSVRALPDPSAVTRVSRSNKCIETKKY